MLAWNHLELHSGLEEVVSRGTIREQAPGPKESWPSKRGAARRWCTHLHSENDSFTLCFIEVSPSWSSDILWSVVSGELT